VVRNIRTGAQHEIGEMEPPCHSSSMPSWSPDGRTLVFTWGPSTLPARSSPARYETGCAMSAPSEIAVVPAGQTGAISLAELHPADPGCSYQAATYDHWGFAAVETCGRLGLGTAKLVQLDSRGEATKKTPLPSRCDGVTVSATRAGTQVAVDEYQAPGTDHPGVPIELVKIFNGRKLRTVIRDQSRQVEFATWL
jgi:hypothetical protein